MSHTVFISYAAEDKAIADAVCLALEAGGISCWYAPRDISYTDEYEEAIIDAIAGSKLMLLVLSSHSNGSRHVKSEVQNACREEPQIPVLPLLVEDIKLNKTLSYYIGSVNRFEALTPPLEGHLRRLVDFVRQRWVRADGETSERPEAEQTKKLDRILVKREETAKPAQDQKQKEARRQREEEEQQKKLVEEAAKSRAAEEQRALAEKELKEAAERKRREAAQAAARQADEERQQREDPKKRRGKGDLSFDDKPLGQTQLSMSAKDMLTTVLRQSDSGTTLAVDRRGDKVQKTLQSEMYEMSKALGAGFDLDRIFKIATDIIFGWTPADRVVALLSDGIVTEQNADETKLFPIAIRARDETMAAHARQMTIGRTIARKVMKDRVALLSQDAAADEQFAGVDSIVSQGVRSTICAPLVTESGVYGALYADRLDPFAAFKPDDLELISTVAAQTAIAVENVREQERLPK
jgi:hypothetical protein